MEKTLIEELAKLKGCFHVDSAEADLLRRAILTIDEQERAIRNYKKCEEKNPLFGRSGARGLGRLFLGDLANPVAEN